MNSMMVKVVHFLNQFFAGIGGEKETYTQVAFVKGAVGLGVALQECLGDRGQITTTVICGTDFYHEYRDTAVSQILGFLKADMPDVIIAGPAFNSGRYGVACGHLCLKAQEQLGITCLAAMYPENPAVRLFGKEVIIIPTGATVVGARDAIRRLADAACELVNDNSRGATNQIERATRFRALDVILPENNNSRSGFVPAPPIGDQSEALICLATEGGVVPLGNPDKFPLAFCRKWHRYDVVGIDDLSPQTHECVHGGYDTTLASQDPDRVLPVDALRKLEKQRLIGRLADFYYCTVGNYAAVADCTRFGMEIADDLGRMGVDGVILTTTCVTGTRCGTIMALAIERVGIPVALITGATQVPLEMGVSRIVRGGRLMHPCGIPSLPSDQERDFRLKLVSTALKALCTEVVAPTLFD